MADSHFFASHSFVADGFVLRAYRPGDGAAMQVAVNTSYDHLRLWMPWATPEQSLEASEANCRRFAGEYLLNQNYTLGIWIGDELVGGTGFHLREGPPEWRNAEIGMWIRASHAGQGLGARALAALLRWGFEDWGWERLTWRCDTRNLASARVAEKNGLRLEGTHRSDALDVDGRRRDTHMFAILREEWASRKSSSISRLAAPAAAPSAR
jgi:RimJ/RimL family protein N-acetyltransferase